MVMREFSNSHTVTVYDRNLEEIFKFSDCRHGTRNLVESSADIKERTHENGSVLLLISQHPKMSECIHDCLFFIGWANQLFALALTDVVIVSFFKSALVLDLGNV